MTPGAVNLNNNAKRRPNENALSDEFFYDSDEVQEEPSDIDNLTQGEEDALEEEDRDDDSENETDDGHGSFSRPKGTKRKANDDGRGHGQGDLTVGIIRDEISGSVYAIYSRLSSNSVFYSKV
ncbi:hypothetical protein ACHAQC_009431 [Fusarium culmorum]